MSVEYTAEDWDRATQHLIRERMDDGHSESEAAAMVDDWTVREWLDGEQQDRESRWFDDDRARRKENW